MQQQNGLFEIGQYRRWVGPKGFFGAQQQTRMPLPRGKIGLADGLSTVSGQFRTLGPIGTTQPSELVGRYIKTRFQQGWVNLAGNAMMGVAESGT